MDAAAPRCPICDQVLGPVLTTEAQPFLPFCSKRCKLLDLSRWLSEEYRVAGEPLGDGGARLGGGGDDDEELA